jgi:hypothetical protein
LKKIPIFIIVLALVSLSFSLIRNGSAKSTSRPASVKHQNGSEPFALIELFTSEGCSSCPPAYQVVKDIVENAKQNHQKVMLLDFHVDYFNSMGWTDSFSKKEFTARQEAYAQVFPEASMYTPQMIVNGTFEGLGSDAKIAERSVERSLKLKPKSATIHLTKIEKQANDSLHIFYNSSNIPPKALVVFALVQKSATVKIIAGENEGKTLTHYNVVRALKTIHGDNVKNSIILGGYKMPKGADYSVIAFVQDPVKLGIVAADSLDK